MHCEVSPTFFQGLTCTAPVRQMSQGGRDMDGLYACGGTNTGLADDFGGTKINVLDVEIEWHLY